MTVGTVWFYVRVWAFGVWRLDSMENVAAGGTPLAHTSSPGWTEDLEEAIQLVARVVEDLRERLRQIRDSKIWEVEKTARTIRRDMEAV